MRWEWGRRGGLGGSSVDDDVMTEVSWVQIEDALSAPLALLHLHSRKVTGSSTYATSGVSRVRIGDVPDRGGRPQSEIRAKASLSGGRNGGKWKMGKKDGSDHGKGGGKNDGSNHGEGGGKNDGSDYSEPRNEGGIDGGGNTAAADEPSASVESGGDNEGGVCISPNKRRRSKKYGESTGGSHSKKKGRRVISSE